MTKTDKIVFILGFFFICGITLNFFWWQANKVESMQIAEARQHGLENVDHLRLVDQKAIAEQKADLQKREEALDKRITYLHDILAISLITQTDPEEAAKLHQQLEKLKSK